MTVSAVLSLQVWTRPSQVFGAILRRDPIVLNRGVRWWLRLGHCRTISRPRDFLQEQGAGSHPFPLGHARSFGLRHTRATGQERSSIRRVSVVQGRIPDLLWRRTGLLGKPISDPRPEHSRYLGLPGGPYGSCGGLPCSWRPTWWCGGSHLPGRLIRPTGVGWRPWHLRGAEGEGAEERALGHVLDVRLLRAGHRHRQGPTWESERPLGGPRDQQRLGLCYQLHPRVLDFRVLLEHAPPPPGAGS